MIMKKIGLIVVGMVFLLGLVYELLPSPRGITQFPPLPGSTKSQLEGDTIQNPNIAAYFSNFNRAGITAFYKDFFSRQLIKGVPLPVVALNHPPEDAYTYVRDQQESTFLEEYVFPMHESLFVNGYEPMVENIMHNNIRSYEGDRIDYHGIWYLSKATLRYYPSNVLVRTTLYICIWLSGLALFKLYKKAWTE